VTVHVNHASYGSVTGASRFLIGLDTCFATDDGIPAIGRAMRRDLHLPRLAAGPRRLAR